MSVMSIASRDFPSRRISKTSIRSSGSSLATSSANSQSWFQSVKVSMASTGRDTLDRNRYVSIHFLVCIIAASLESDVLDVLAELFRHAVFDQHMRHQFR